MEIETITSYFDDKKFSDDNVNELNIINNYWKQNIIHRSNVLVLRLKNNGIYKDTYDMFCKYEPSILKETLDNIIDDVEFSNKNTEYMMNCAGCIKRIINILKYIEHLNYDYYVSEKSDVPQVITSSSKFNNLNKPNINTPLELKSIIMYAHSIVYNK
jgi:hypothetical protein